MEWMKEWDDKMNKLIKDVEDYLEPNKIDKIITYASLGYLVFQAFNKRLLAFYGFNGSLVVLEERFNNFDFTLKE